MSKTTSDEINIDLDGTIDEAIAELKRLKKLHPDGTVSLESDYEYGESYPRLKLRFTREMEPVEIELEKWDAKRRKLGAMEDAAAAYAKEGDTYPRAAQMKKLRSELGCFADDMVSLVICDDEVVAFDYLHGGRRRNGEWVFRTLGSEMFDRFREEDAAQGIVTEGGDADAAPVSEAN